MIFLTARAASAASLEDGEVSVESAPYDPPTPDALPVALAATPSRRSDRFLYHKTTHRAVYDLQQGTPPDGLRRSALERSRGGHRVPTAPRRRLDGRRWTPPRECGLLAGTLRAELLERGEIEERVITRADLLRASRLWLINSVRGWVPVYLEIYKGMQFVSDVRVICESIHRSFRAGNAAVSSDIVA